MASSQSGLVVRPSGQGSNAGASVSLQERKAARRRRTAAGASGANVEDGVAEKRACKDEEGPSTPAMRFLEKTTDPDFMAIKEACFGPFAEKVCHRVRLVHLGPGLKVIICELCSTSSVSMCPVLGTAEYAEAT